MAKIHEFAGKSGNNDFIDSNYPKLVMLYRDILNNIEAALRKLPEKEQ